jgi:hypothetical protein
MLIYNFCGSEFERKEREMKKRIGELSRGVQISEKDHEALKAELERVVAKASKAEGKRAQVTGLLMSEIQMHRAIDANNSITADCARL